MDRVLQQAIVQVLIPIYEEQISNMVLDQIAHVKWQLLKYWNILITVMTG